MIDQINISDWFSRENGTRDPELLKPTYRNKYMDLNGLYSLLMLCVVGYLLQAKQTAALQSV